MGGVRAAAQGVESARARARSEQEGKDRLFSHPLSLHLSLSPWLQVAAQVLDLEDVVLGCDWREGWGGESGVRGDACIFL